MSSGIYKSHDSEMNNNLLVKQTTKSFTQIYDAGTNVGTED